MWSDSIYLNETVATGEVNIQWDCLQVSDPFDNYAGYADVTGDGDVYGTGANAAGEGNGKLDDSLEYYDTTTTDKKNIAYKNAILEDDDNVNAGTEESDVTDLNATQQEDDVLSIELKNGYPGYHATVTACISNIGTVPVKIHYTADGIPSWLDFQILDAVGGNVIDLEGQQIDPGQKFFVTFDETVTDDAPQLSNATINLTLEGIQWNAYGVSEAQ